MFSSFRKKDHERRHHIVNTLQKGEGISNAINEFSEEMNGLLDEYKKLCESYDSIAFKAKEKQINSLLNNPEDSNILLSGLRDYGKNEAKYDSRVTGAQNSEIRDNYRKLESIIKSCREKKLFIEKEYKEIGENMDKAKKQITKNNDTIRQVIKELEENARKTQKRIGYPYSQNNVEAINLAKSLQEQLNLLNAKKNAVYVPEEVKKSEPERPSTAPAVMVSTITSTTEADNKKQADKTKKYGKKSTINASKIDNIQIVNRGSSSSTESLISR